MIGLRSGSPHLPITPDQIATSAIGAAEAGAAILHLHARNPEDGSPSSDPAVFRLFLPQIKDSTDAIINITTGGAATMTIEQRIAGPLALKPEMCSLNMGSMNFGLYPALNKFREWQHDWEVPYLNGSRDRIFRNTFTDIETILERLDNLGKPGSQAFQRRQAVMNFLMTEPGAVDVAWIYAESGGKAADLRWLSDRGLVRLGESHVWRDPLEGLDFVPDPRTASEAAV